MPSLSQPHPLEDAEVDALLDRTETPILLDFWAPWCGPCKALAPTLDRLASHFVGRLTVAKVDIEASPEVAERFQVQTVPTLLLLHRGRVLDRAVGTRSESDLTRWIQTHLA